MWTWLRLLSEAVVSHGLLLHGSAVARKNRSYVFLAGSGGGKSTLSSICERAGLRVLADDGALVLEKEPGFHVRPMPRQARVPPADVPIGDASLLEGVFFLAKAGYCSNVEPVTPLGALKRCLREHSVLGFVNMTPTERHEVLGRLFRLFRTVPAYVLHFRKDNSFWKVIDELEEREKAERART